jgi:hypothetical protein
MKIEVKKMEPGNYETKKGSSHHSKNLRVPMMQSERKQNER